MRRLPVYVHTKRIVTVDDNDAHKAYRFDVTVMINGADAGEAAVQFPPRLNVPKGLKGMMRVENGAAYLAVHFHFAASPNRPCSGNDIMITRLTQLIAHFRKARNPIEFTGSPSSAVASIDSVIQFVRNNG